MTTGTQITVSEYLATSFRPDREYLGGELVERNLGEKNHSRLQSAIWLYFHSRRREWGLFSFVELRIRVSASRFRIPDVCITLGDPPEQVLTQPPFACIEVLSPDDRLSEMQERVQDYLAFGVPYVWIVDPATRKAWRCTQTGMQQVAELRTEDPATVVPLADLFQD